MFICDETVLLREKRYNRTDITREEKPLPGHSPMKDRITLLICGNVSSDCNIKSMVIYHSENPKIFKRINVTRRKLPDIWRSNSLCVQDNFVVEWMYETLSPQLKEYLKKNS